MAKKNELDGSQIYLPSDTCIICNKHLEEVGGERIIAQQPRGIIIRNEYEGEENAKYPRRSFILSENPNKYLVVWGEKELWTDGVIKRAKAEYEKGKQSWFCQVCGKRTCGECGSPINVPMGSDILSDDGRSIHVAILPVDPGCINPKCKKHKRLASQTII